MKKISVLFFVLIFLTGCGQKESEKVILCGTSVISSMVRDITGDNNVKTLVPHLVCPGSYDLKPDDAKKIINSKILIIHPFQKYLLDKIIKINKNIRVIYVDLSDLNSPGGYINGLDEVEKFLMEIFPEKKQQYAMNKENTVSKIKQRITDDAMLVKTISNKNIKVIASSHQQGFCNYLGLKVVSVFSGPDSLKPKDLADIIKLAKKEKVQLIISNLTGDDDTTADILNGELKTKKLTFMYFPAEESQDSWFFNAYNYNLEQIKTVVK